MSNPQDKPDDLPALEIPCETCKGRGWTYGSWSPCDECDGVGSIPTATGEKALALMRHHLARMLRDEGDTIKAIIKEAMVE